ncbi:uncharacterized protein LOC133783088 isoform X2 [Humulus lupulus]|uniref:uncharacterized protein LOC133783088 isoform X2 n=1 Tax=Humulus lupulus TaxID=3486 RepID=UPI002B40B2C3|nr:uncharacterized protein LOC133783088 isoform X2 [Humulus lupulus]
MERLSYDNVFEILLFFLRRRLNYGDEEKEVARCMCVSKLWYRVISDILRQVLWPHSPIVGLYHIRSTNIQPKRVRFAQHTASRSNHTTHHATTPDRFLCDNRPITNFFFIDCCNGLLLIFDIKYDIYYVCNPYTRRRTDIPKPHHHHFPFAKNILCVALAYDPLESSFYKVVIITATATTTGMGCLGVSMIRTTACLSYCRRERTTYGVWLCHVDDGDEWIPTYTISIEQLKTRCTIGLFISHDDILLMEPCAIGPNPCVMFFGIRGTIFSYNFKTNVLKLVHETPVAPDNSNCFFPVFTFRACLLPFQGQDKRNIISSTPSHSHEAFSKVQMGWWKYRLWEDENESTTPSFLKYFVYEVF